MSKSTVADSLGRLVLSGLIEKIGTVPVGQVQPFRILHLVDKGVVTTEIKPECAYRICMKCKGRMRGLNKAGMCRGCHDKASFPQRLAQARGALGAEASTAAVSAYMAAGRRTNLARLQREIEQAEGAA